MNGGNLIRKIQMECPLCDKVHEIEERTRIAKTIIKENPMVNNKFSQDGYWYNKKTGYARGRGIF